MTFEEMEEMFEECEDQEFKNDLRMIYEVLKRNEDFLRGLKDD